MKRETTLNHDIERRPVPTPTDLDRQAAKDIAGATNGILADVFALYI